MNWSISKPIQLIATESYIQALCECNLKGNILLLLTPSLAKKGHEEQIYSALPSAKVSAYIQRINNPDIKQIESIADSYKGCVFEAIIAIGGGSIIDTAKVLSVILHPSTQDKSLAFLKNGVKKEFAASIPLYALPTTSGTGAECTPFATVWDIKAQKKYSLESSRILPWQVILDPNIVVDLPEEQTLFTSLDALSHATETLWNKNQNPLAIAFAKEAIELIEQNLHRVLDKPKDLKTRAQMQFASYLAGLAISITKTAIAHAISYPLTYRFDVPHGLACSFSIPAVFKYLETQSSHEINNISHIKKSVTLIKSLGLKKYLSSYLDLEELQSISGAMNNPQRFSNFIVAPSLDELLMILNDSWA